MNAHDILTQKRLRHLEPMVAEITVEELQSKFALDETFKLIELSDPDDYAKGHIEGALHISPGALKEEAQKRFLTFQQIVLYTEEANSSIAIAGARLLQSLGFSNVVVLKGGKEAWKNAGLDLQGEKEPERSDDKS